MSSYMSHPLLPRNAETSKSRGIEYNVLSTKPKMNLQYITVALL